jgi:3-oxoacyl-ACP reductase-like protein
MSIFSAILSKILPSRNKAETTAADPSAATPQAPAAAQPAAGARAVAAPSGAAPVDVEAVLSAMQAQHPEKLNWKTSIVDLLKLLGLDSSLASRKELAGELGYSGNTDDSAAMNIWLHKQVMRKLAENGGKLPADMLD